MRRVILVGAGLLSAALTLQQAEASQAELKAALTVSEEYNDNVYGTDDGRKTDFITRVQPGANLTLRGPQITLDSAYIFDYRNYAKGSHGDEEIHNVDLKGNLQFLENFLLLDLGEALHRTTVDVARNVATESLLVRQTTQNIATVSPYFVWRASEKGTLKTGYRYTDTRYFDRNGVDKQEQVGFANYEHQVSEKLTLYGGYSFTSGDSAPTGYQRNDCSGGFRYNFGPTSSLFGNVGNSWNRFSGGTRTSHLFWDAGVSHDFGLAVALLQSAVQNIEDPQSVATRQVSYTGRLDRNFSRGAVGVSAVYLENFIIETDRFESRRGTLSATGRYELLPKLAASGSIYAERFSGNSADQYPYRLTANATLSWAFFNEVSAVTASYSLVCDRQEWDSSRGEKLTNRVVLEVRSAY